MTTYINSFYYSDKANRKEKLTTDSKPVAYKTYLIYHRVKSADKSGNVFDVVKDGICVANYCGKNGAKGFIDKQLKN